MEVDKVRGVLGKLAEHIDPKVTYLIGGYVRDVLLQIDASPDIDLVTTESYEQVGAKLKQAQITHSRYDKMLTFKVDLGDLIVDLVRARREFYKSPGSIAYCEEASLEEDCKRRDFTVNCLMFRLSDFVVGKISPIDIVGGLFDLNNRLLRALRCDQFEEDPARLIRAIRYASKLNFYFEEHTASLVRQGLSSLLYTTSSSRIILELKKLFDECPAEAIKSTVLRNKFFDVQIPLLRADFLEQCVDCTGSKAVFEKFKSYSPGEYERLGKQYGVNLNKL